MHKRNHYFVCQITVKDETSDSSESEQVQPKKRSKVDVEQVKVCFRINNL